MFTMVNNKEKHGEVICEGHQYTRPQQQTQVSAIWIMSHSAPSEFILLYICLFCRPIIALHTARNYLFILTHGLVSFNFALTLES